MDLASLLLHDPLQHLLGVVLVPLREVLAGGHLDSRALLALLLHLDRDIKITLLALELSLLTTVFRARRIGDDSLLVHDRARPGAELVDRAVHKRFRSA